jgi:hypothetical protein
MRQYAWYFEHGNVRYVVLTLTPEADHTNGGQTIYVSGLHEALYQARAARAERVNF